ncbi:AAA family ATPase [Aeromonas rivipollensis]|uniref:AAA family ATPase n=1 Tax=Aeromonas rivipollensis TaxID=948519 RepID=UPI0038D16056
MKIQLLDIGPIAKFEIDLDKDFHLILGPNNIGKSYAITIVYLIVKNIISSIPTRQSHLFPQYIDMRHMYVNDSVNLNNKKISEVASKLEQKQEAEVTNLVKDDISKYIGELIIHQLGSSLNNTFSSMDSLRNRFSMEEPKIVLSDSNSSLEIVIKNGELKVSSFSTQYRFYVKRIKQAREPVFHGNKVTIYYCTEKENDFPYFYMNLILVKFVFGFFMDAIKGIKSIHYLPASRSGLYQALSAFGQIIAELSKNRSFLSKKIELPGISEPVSDYFIKLSDIRVVKKNFEDKIVNDIAKNIEKNILKGRVEFNPQTKQLMFYPDNTNLKLELSSTSSMVSELAPIVSYLRYVLTASPSQRLKTVKKHLIMIEEPEAHLHPEIQIKLTEIFSKLVNADVKLIVTSHSNYIFNKVNNLIMSRDMDMDRVYSGVFKNTTSGSVMLPLNVDEFGVDDDNFGLASSILFDEKIDIIERMNESDDDLSDSLGGDEK